MSSHPGPARDGRSGRDGGQHDPAERAVPRAEDSQPEPPAAPREAPAANTAGADTAEDPLEGYEAL